MPTDTSENGLETRNSNLQPAPGVGLAPRGEPGLHRCGGSWLLKELCKFAPFPFRGRPGADDAESLWATTARRLSSGYSCLRPSEWSCGFSEMSNPWPGTVSMARLVSRSPLGFLGRSYSPIFVLPSTWFQRTRLPDRARM